MTRVVRALDKYNKTYLALPGEHKHIIDSGEGNEYYRQNSQKPASTHSPVWELVYARWTLIGQRRVVDDRHDEY